MYRVWDFVSTYSLLMVAGAVIALLWANIDPASHHALVEMVLWDHAPIGHAHLAADGSVEYRTLTLQFLVNDVLMALFFAVAAKNVIFAVPFDGTRFGAPEDVSGAEQEPHQPSVAFDGETAYLAWQSTPTRVEVSQRPAP